MTDRQVLATCRVIAAAFCAAAVITNPARLLAVVELPLVGLLVIVSVAAAWRRRAARSERHRNRPLPFRPRAAAEPPSTYREPRLSNWHTPRGITSDH